MTSKYFNEFNDIEEQRLYDALINEVVFNLGVETLYLPRESGSSVDLLFGEDPTSVFTLALPVDVYVQSVDGFEGGELFTKFGLEARKQARFLLTTRSFNRAVAAQNPSNYFGSNTALLRPREGDLLWFHNFKALFEIKYADEEYLFYTFGKHNIYGYSLTCEKFRYSNEVVATGDVDLDSAMNNVVAAYAFTMANTYSSYSYTPGEEVYQGANTLNTTATATIVSWNLPTLTLTLKHIQGTFNVNSAIVGVNSNAIFTMVSDNLLAQVNPNVDNNQDIATEGDAVLNFNEENPFGEPTP